MKNIIKVSLVVFSFNLYGIGFGAWGGGYFIANGYGNSVNKITSSYSSSSSQSLSPSPYSDVVSNSSTFESSPGGYSLGFTTFWGNKKFSYGFEAGFASGYYAKANVNYTENLNGILVTSKWSYNSMEMYFPVGGFFRREFWNVLTFKMHAGLMAIISRNTNKVAGAYAGTSLGVNFHFGRYLIMDIDIKLNFATRGFKPSNAVLNQASSFVNTELIPNLSFSYFLDYGEYRGRR